jgi:ATP-dependent DNA helicase DinG
VADAGLLIQLAFDRLAERPGFVERPDQKQLALLLSDCIEGEASAAFEAPTGLGKSLASLIPAIAHALASGKRTVIATYTNVLAEQYWRSDLPLALSLFECEPPKTQFLIGRQRYACLASLSEMPKMPFQAFRDQAELGIETEFRQWVLKPGRELTQDWQRAAAPPVCPARLCQHYDACYYYRARRKAEKAHIVITNHSVIIQDALLRKASEGDLTLLDDYDFLIIDEAHDFPQAAMSGLEFEVSEAKIGVLAGIGQRMQGLIQPLALQAGQPGEWNRLCDGFRENLERSKISLKEYGGLMGQGILQASPETVSRHPQVQAKTAPAIGLQTAQALAEELAAHTLNFVAQAELMIRRWRDDGAIEVNKGAEALESIANYSMYLREFGAGCQTLLSSSSGVGVAYVSGSLVRHDVIGLAEPLREMLWSSTPSACLSATLAVDGNFDFFKRMTGAEPEFEEILPSPFDFSTQAALYIPPRGAIPDPGEARKLGSEQDYYRAVARELSLIIRTMEGRTLALFHSRKEMEAVHALMDLPDDLPLLMQRWSGAGSIGERFQREIRAPVLLDRVRRPRRDAVVRSSGASAVRGARGSSADRPHGLAAIARAGSILRLLPSACQDAHASRRGAADPPRGRSRGHRPPGPSPAHEALRRRDSRKPPPGDARVQ